MIGYFAFFLMMKYFVYWLVFLSKYFLSIFTELEKFICLFKKKRQSDPSFKTKRSSESDCGQTNIYQQKPVNLDGENSGKNLVIISQVALSEKYSFVY